jgi:hypothetical protein
MKLFNKIALLTMLIITCMVGSTSSLYSQNETGTRNISVYEEMLKARHKWYDTSTIMYQYQFPIITSIPPLSISMPFNVLLSYIYTDSLLRFAHSRPLMKRISAWNSLNDTLKWMAYGDYVMSDYNPIVFKQYKQETLNWQIVNTDIRSNSKFDTLPDIVGKYNAVYSDIKSLLDIKIAEVLPDSDARAIMSLLTCDYILKIKVISIDSMIDKLSSGSFPGSYYYRVTAIVYDTIKGKVLPPPPTNETFAKHEKLLDTSNEHLIQFGYTNRAYHSLGFVGNEGKQSYTEADTAFTRGSSNVFSMKVDQEAVVFLSYFNNVIDYQHDYFDLSLDPLASLNALPIIDGYVRDVNKVWSQDLMTSYPSWKSHVNTLITKILTRNY